MRFTLHRLPTLLLATPLRHALTQTPPFHPNAVNIVAQYPAFDSIHSHSPQSQSLPSYHHHPQSQNQKLPTMSSDDQYSSFIDQANQDTGASTAKSQSKSESPFKTTDTEIPASLQSVDAYYISDTDEPFEPVCLSFSGDELTEKAFSKLIHLTNTPSISTLSLKEFDPRNHYSSIISAVEKAGVSKSEIQVYRVEEGKGSRVQYWVVGLVEGKVVGFRAKAVES